MIVTLEGDLRGFKAMKKKGGDGKYTPVLDGNKKPLSVFRVEMPATEFGLPETLEIVSSKDGRKKGPASFKVDLRIDRDKDGKPTGKFRAFEV